MESRQVSEESFIHILMVQLLPSVCVMAKLYEEQSALNFFGANTDVNCFKGELHPWALFLKTLCIFSKNKATADKLSHGPGQKCSKELKNHSFTLVETIVVKLQ